MLEEWWKTSGHANNVYLLNKWGHHLSGIYDNQRKIKRKEILKNFKFKKKT